MQTNIELFNSNLKLFLLDIIKIFPEYESELRDYYGVILDNETSNEDKFIKRYMRKLTDKKELISSKNMELFAEPIYILKTIDFKEFMANERMNDSIRKTIWDYLQTLFVIGETIVSDSHSIKQLVENFKKLRETDDTIPDIDSSKLEPDSPEQDEQVLNMLKSLSKKTEESSANLNEELINNRYIIYTLFEKYFHSKGLSKASKKSINNIVDNIPCNRLFKLKKTHDVYVDNYNITINQVVI